MYMYKLLYNIGVSSGKHGTPPPSHSLNRTHCGIRPKARHFILGF